MLVFRVQVYQNLPQPLPEPLPQPLPEALPQPLPQPFPEPLPEPHSQLYIIYRDLTTREAENSSRIWMVVG